MTPLGRVVLVLAVSATIEQGYSQGSSRVAAASPDGTTDADAAPPGHDECTIMPVPQVMSGNNSNFKLALVHPPTGPPTGPPTRARR